MGVGGGGDLSFFLSSVARSFVVLGFSSRTKTAKYLCGTYAVYFENPFQNFASSKVVSEGCYTSAQSAQLSQVERTRRSPPSTDKATTAASTAPKQTLTAPLHSDVGLL